MTVARGVALAALGLVVILVAWLLLRGDGGHEYQLLFQNAGQLVRDDNVEVGGRRIGSVRKIELTNDNLARVTIRVEEPYAPLHVGTKATIRLTSLSGIANRYVALALGPDSGEEIPDGAGPRDRLDDQRRRPRPALQRAGPEGAPRPAGRHPGLRHPVRRTRAPRPTRRPSTSTRRSRPRAGWSASSPRTRRR